MKKRIISPSAVHQAVHADITAIVEKYKDLPATELLAIAAQCVGMILAFQDQRTMTPERGLAIVSSNIEAGNAYAIQQSLGSTKGSA